MTIPAIHELDPLEELKQLRATAGDDPLDQLKASKRQPSVRGAAPDATRALPSSRDNASGDFEAAAPTLLGPLAVLSRDIPGIEAAQSGIRALVRGQSYRDARSDIRQAEDAAPAAIRIPARIAGGAVGAMALPGGVVRQGALLGGLQGLAQSDPNAGLKQRVDDAGLGMAVGAGTAGVANNAGRIPWGGVAKALTHPRTAAVKAFGGVIRDALGEARAPVATEAAEAIVPSVDGLLGNGIDNLVDAGAANAGPRRLANRIAPLHLESEPIPPAVGDAVTQQTPEAIRDAVKLAPNRHRTQGQLTYFAEQFAKKQAEAEAARSAVPVEPDLEELLAASLKGVKQGGALNNLTRVMPFPTRTP